MDLHLDNVSKFFARPGRPIWRALSRGPSSVFAAVRGVSLSVGAGQCVGLVGESGCGKSTVARIAAGLIRPDGGSVHTRATAEDISGERLPRLPIQMIFQNPAGSLNARQGVGRAVAEAPMVHRIVGRQDRDAFVDRLFASVGLDPASKSRRPHAFSGGQRQRIVIARALAVRPRILIADEAVSALDVSIQKQVLDLLQELQATLNLGLLFISHDLAVVRRMCDTICVMYLGRIVEQGPAERVLAAPKHPYTALLLGSTLRLDGPKRELKAEINELPSPLAPPPGCAFHTRCPRAMDVCRRVEPQALNVGGVLTACHLYDEPAAVTH